MGDPDSAGDEGICVELAALGERCQGSESCVSEDLYCDDFRLDDTEATHTCKTYPGRGESCSHRNRCAEGSRCNDQDICSALLPDGEPCETYHDCASGYCDYGDDGQGICAPSTRDICRGS